MPVKKVRKVPHKIKSVKKSEESSLEKELEKSKIQKEIEDFVEILSGSGTINPSLNQSEVRQPINPQTANVQRERTHEEEVTERSTASYTEAVRPATYTSSGQTRIRERNFYNPSLRQTPMRPQTQEQPLNLVNRDIQGRQFIGQEPMDNRDLNSQEPKEKKYRPAHEGG